MKALLTMFATLLFGAFAASEGLAALTDGVALYDMRCMDCHGPMATSGKQGATAGKIQNAIKTDKGGMGSLYTLTEQEVQAIAKALAPAPAQTPAPAPASPPVPASVKKGAALYESSCSICHGPVSSSTVSGKSADAIQGAINADKGGMGQFFNLSPEQVASLAVALSAYAPSSPAGEALYNANCSACHGPLAASAKAQATVAGIQNAIKANKGGMGSLSSLSAADIQAISAALATSKGAGTGGMTKGLSCSACHGTSIPGGD